MKNDIVFKTKNKLKINIKGRNINRFIKRLSDNNINMYHIEYVSYNCINVIIMASDYKIVKELQTTYDIYIVETKGLMKVKKIINRNKFLLVFFTIGILFLIGLSKVIFKVEIIHTNKELRQIIISELEEVGIEKLKFKKSYKRLQVIKSEIVSKYKDKIEWLEIESVGIKYIVRVEERRLPDESLILEKRNIVASKSAIIKKVIADSGEIVRNVNDYVKPGDVIITGEIKLHNNVKNTVAATGQVFGETWYQGTVNYPMMKKIEIPQPEYRKVLTLQILNKRIELFNFKPFKYKKSNDQIILKNKLLPISLLIDKQQKLLVKEEINTIDEAIDKAIKLGSKKIEDKLKEEEYIISQKSLKVDVKSSKIEVDIFFVVYEDITDYQKIEEKPLETTEE